MEKGDAFLCSTQGSKSERKKQHNLATKNISLLSFFPSNEIPFPLFQCKVLEQKKIIIN